MILSSIFLMAFFHRFFSHGFFFDGYFPQFVYFKRYSYLTRGYDYVFITVKKSSPKFGTSRLTSHKKKTKHSYFSFGLLYNFVQDVYNIIYISCRYVHRILQNTQCGVIFFHARFIE